MEHTDQDPINIDHECDSILLTHADHLLRLKFWFSFLSRVKKPMMMILEMMMLPLDVNRIKRRL